MKPYYEDTEAGIVLYCADCRDVLPTLEPATVDLVLTDPPYAVSVAGAVHVNRHGKGVRRLDFFANDADWNGTIEMVIDSVNLALDSLASTGSLYLWVGHREFCRVVPLLEAAGFSTRFLVWAKAVVPPQAPGSGWSSGAELCVYAYRSGRTWNGRGRLTPKTNVLVADSYRFGQPGKVDHPTQKPLTVITPEILMSSNHADLILDPFAGSGATLVAAKQLGRRAIGIEIEERYCEITAGRLQQTVMRFEETDSRPEQLTMETVE